MFRARLRRCGRVSSARIADGMVRIGVSFGMAEAWRRVRSSSRGIVEHLPSVEGTERVEGRKTEMSNNTLVQEKIDRVLDFAVSELGIPRDRVVGYLIQVFKLETRKRDFHAANLERKRVLAGFPKIREAAAALGVSLFRIRRIESGKLADPVLAQRAEALYRCRFEAEK